MEGFVVHFVRETVLPAINNSLSRPQTYTLHQIINYSAALTEHCKLEVWLKIYNQQMLGLKWKGDE